MKLAGIRKSRNRPDHHEKDKKYKEIVDNLGIGVGVAQKHAADKLLEYVNDNKVELLEEGGSHQSRLLCKVADYIADCKRIKAKDPKTKKGIHQPAMMKDIRELAILTGLGEEEKSMAAKLSKETVILMLKDKNKTIMDQEKLIIEKDKIICALQEQMVLQMEAMCPAVHDPPPHPPQTQVKPEDQDDKKPKMEINDNKNLGLMDAVADKNLEELCNWDKLIAKLDTDNLHEEFAAALIQ